ncbi:MAG: hypothetical protein ACTHMU_15900 [Thermomicrobiales bacterium]
MADRSAAGGVMVALVGAVALVAGVRGVYGKIWHDLTAGTGPQVSTTPPAGGTGSGGILSVGGAAARSLGLGGAAALYAPQTPNGQYIAGAGLYDHNSSSPYGNWSLPAGAVNEGATLLTSYNAARDVARWSYAQNPNESAWTHFDRLRHDLMKNFAMTSQAASDEALREMYAAITAAGGNWSATGFGVVPLAGPLHI